MAGVRKAVLLVALLPVILTGCGDDDPPSEDEFRMRATSACERYNRAARAVPIPRSIAEIPRTADKTAALLDRLASDLRAIEAPGNLAGRFARLIARAEEAKTALASLRAAARAGDRRRLREAALRAQRRDRKTERLARQLRLPACAES